MTALQVSRIMYSSFSSSSWRRRTIRGSISMPRLATSRVPFPTLSSGVLVEDLEPKFSYTTPTISHDINFSTIQMRDETNVSDPLVIAKLYAIMEAVADRVEMHKNIGEQRSNWNSLLLTSINAITLTAATMAGIGATSLGAPLVALKLSSTLMYLAATCMLLIMNKIQPSQLAEEQRNAARLLKQLRVEIEMIMFSGAPTIDDVKDSMAKVLVLDKAYPLPVIGVMLDKFPSTVEPAVWWPRRTTRKGKGSSGKLDGNGWIKDLEEEMREIVGVVQRKDKADYLRLAEKALKINKVLAISGPLLTGLAAVGAAFVGSPSHGSWAVVLGVGGGALASVVNTMEHGGQVGMVFEMYRSSAGFFELMEESIESNLKEGDVESRENGELFELKVALQLGRSLSEIKELAASSGRRGEANEEFASKLF